MSINLDNVVFSGEQLVTAGMSECQKKEMNSCSKLSAEKIIQLKNKFSKKQIFNSEYAFDVMDMFVRGCIISYHEQLRETLLEQSVDIGDLDISFPGNYRKSFMNGHQKDCE